MKEIRLHGRGGQGVVKASQIIVRAAVVGGGNGQFIPFFGVERSDDAPPTPITFEDATTRPGINFEGQFNDQFNWCVQGSGMFQLSLGVGLCGTLGIRVAGEVDVIATYEPGLREGIRDWGCFLNFRAGIIIDAFLGSIPLMYDFYHMKFGKFWDLEQESGTNSMRDIKPTVGAFRLRSGSEETSEWEYSCYYNAETKSLEAMPAGIHTDNVYGEDGEIVSSTVIYDDGEATFTLDEEGHLLWRDAKEDAGKDMLFEKVEIPDNVQ